MSIEGTAMSNEAHIKQIADEVNLIRRFAESKDVELTNDQAFNILILQFYCFRKPHLTDDLWFDIRKCIVDGSRDGGIDYVFFDEEEPKVLLGQNKYSGNVDAGICANEIGKLINTLDHFSVQATGSYNDKVRKELQESLDRLTDETSGNVEIIFSSLEDVDGKLLLQKLKSVEHKTPSIVLLGPAAIVSYIDRVQSESRLVDYDSLDIDDKDNYLFYENESMEGMFVNVTSTSLIRLFNKYRNDSLFSLNIRKFIRSKNVDEGITETLNKSREDFWFLNNGLTIACEDFSVDGKKVKMSGFSIVNGGQTTTLIGNYKGSNHDDFLIPCKIIRIKDEEGDQEKSLRFINRIAEATNSQKPIQPKDLKSNAPEMIRLKRQFADRNVALIIKRGDKSALTSPRYRINNDDFAQLMFSFVFQRPGTARINKRSLFSNNSSYNLIFKQNYNEEKKMDFLVDLINLNNRFDLISKAFKGNSKTLNKDESNIFFNSKLTMFALFGVAYRVVNNDLSFEDIKSDSRVLNTNQIEYGKFLSNYLDDDLDEKLESLIKMYLPLLDSEYQKQYKAGDITSVSNLFKTDKKYQEEIVPALVSTLSGNYRNPEFLDYGKIFLRIC